MYRKAFFFADFEAERSKKKYEEMLKDKPTQTFIEHTGARLTPNAIRLACDFDWSINYIFVVTLQFNFVAFKEPP